MNPLFLGPLTPVVLFLVPLLAVVAVLYAIYRLLT